MIVSVIVPCRNERDYIETFIQNILTQETELFGTQVVIADGESNDGTREILNRLSNKYPSIEVVSNPGRIVSTGLNLAIEKASGEIIVRMDVHTLYNPDYIRQCVKVLRDTKAQCVGGAWQAKGVGPKQIAIADAFQSPIGSGGASSRHGLYNGPCDTVYLGCWWKNDLVKFGGFDEDLVRNQDDELSLRITKLGGIIWQSASIRSAYVPRASFRALFLQFRQYGYWKVAVAKKHGKHASWRHIIPFVFVSTNLFLITTSLFFPFLLWGLMLFDGIYLLTVLISAALISSDKSIQHIFQVASAIVIMHSSYGIGYGFGMIDFVFIRRDSRSNMSMLSR